MWKTPFRKFGHNFELTDKATSLCQKQYLIKLLERYKLTEANTVTTPMDPNVKLVKDDSHSKKAQYQSMVGICYMQLELHAQT